MNESSSSASSSRNVSRAVARSRAIRSGVARRRRRVAALVACLGTLVAAPIAWFMAEPAAAVVASAASEARDLADLLGQRSPGARTQAELTKHARPAAKTRPSPRTVAHESARHDPNTAALVDLLEPPVAPVAVVAEGLQPPLAPPPTLAAILTSAPIGQSFTPPSGDEPESLPSSEPREQLPPTSAVPEPGTWTMMLLGFGLMAWRMRRRRSASAESAARPAAN